MKFLLGKKLGMTTIYNKEKAENVTLVEIGKNVVTDLRTQEKDGYLAVQVGVEKSAKKGKKEEKVKFENLTEFRVEDLAGYEKGKEVAIDQFAQGDKVKIAAISKGKGTQGVVKRHGFAGSPASHGHRHDLRAPGSIGSAFPERVMKGKKMAGRMGHESVTTKNIVVSLVDAEKRIVAVRGAVPGSSGTLVKIFAS